MEFTIQKKEAVARLKRLGVLSDVIKQFEESGTLHRSEQGILYWLTDEEKEMVSSWEKKTENVAYFVIKNKFEFGLCYSILYVSKYEDEWNADNEDLDDGFPFVYVENVDDNACSEYGRIGISLRYGALVRTA